jgi:hypothetical protein
MRNPYDRLPGVTLAASLVVLGVIEAAESGPPPASIHWRFEKGAQGQPVQIASDEGGKCEAVAASLKDTSQSELFIGSLVKGDLPFFGMIDEVRITPAVLGPKSFLLAGTQPIPELRPAREPLFVSPGTRIDAALRAKAQGAPIVLKPGGYPYFYTECGGPANRIHCGAVPQGFDPDLGLAMQAFNMSFAATK